VLSAHARPLSAGALDDVFGVAQTPFSPAGDTALATPDEDLPRLTLSAEMGGSELPVPAYDRKLKTTTASALASDASGVPAVTLNRYGEGAAVLLNFDAGLYDGLRQEHGEATLREVLRAVLARCGIRPRIEITHDGRALDACETVFFTTGDVEYVAVVKDDNTGDTEPRRARIRLPHEAFVFDVRSGESLGRTAEITAEITPGVPKLYALLPYKSVSPRVEISPKTIRPGDAVAFRVKLEAPGAAITATHAVRLRVVGPDGKSRGHYAQNLLAAGEGAEGSVHLALNDAAGSWKLVFREVATGAVGEVGFRVEVE
jgi:hypothetical protein